MMMMMVMMMMMMMTLQVGDNILGVHQWIDIERTYDVEKITSDRSVDNICCPRVSIKWQDHDSHAA